MNKASTFLVAILLLVSCRSNAQTKKIQAGGIEMEVAAVDTSLSDAFCSVGAMPEFPGGTTKLVAFAKRNIKYPQTAINDGVHGSVILIFAIDKKGKVTGKRIFQSVRHDLDHVCLRMLSQMPNWKPGRIQGKRIAVYERWKITFVLTD